MQCACCFSCFQPDLLHLSSSSLKKIRIVRVGSTIDRHNSPESHYSGLLFAQFLALLPAICTNCHAIVPIFWTIPGTAWLLSAKGWSLKCSWTTALPTRVGLWIKHHRSWYVLVHSYPFHANYMVTWSTLPDQSSFSTTLRIVRRFGQPVPGVEPSQTAQHAAPKSNTGILELPCVRLRWLSEKSWAKLLVRCSCESPGTQTTLKLERSRIRPVSSRNSWRPEASCGLDENDESIWVRLRQTYSSCSCSMAAVVAVQFYLPSYINITQNLSIQGGIRPEQQWQHFLSTQSEPSEENLGLVQVDWPIQFRGVHTQPEAPCPAAAPFQQFAF